MSPTRGGAVEAKNGHRPERREIDLHRRVCVIKPDVIDVRPARSAAVVPFITFSLGVLAFVAVLFWLEQMPFAVTLLLIGAALLLVPFSAMGFVYSVYGANVVIDRTKGTAVWQQGFLGMGVGTQELAPFAKIEGIEVEEVSREEQMGGAQDLAQFEIQVLKTSGRRLSIGQVTVPRYLRDDGLARAREVGEAVAEMTGRPLDVIAEQPPRERRRRRSRGSPATVA
jgi:hypothetical protein